jgi:DNA-binding PadR family transcriptional regulator
VESVNSTAAALLGFLHRRPMTGWQVVEVAELELCDFWNLTRSQVYRELAKLTEGGLIQAGEKGVRDQVPYSITDVGRQAFLEWLNKDPGPEILRSPIHLKLAFAEHLDDQTCARFVRIQRRRNEERLEYYQRLETNVQDIRPGAMHVLRSGIMYRKWMLSWLASLPWAAGAPND